MRNMGVNGKQSSTVIIHDPIVVSSPGGEPITRPFDWDDLCWECGVPFRSDAHRSFVFYNSPADIEHAEVMGGVPSEWRPSPESPPIPGDQGPARAAFWNEGEAQVQVHEGDDHGNWLPCSSFTETRKGLPYCMWICRRHNVTDPCDEDFMKDIST
jgi:hypothetical protein